MRHVRYYRLPASRKRRGRFRYWFLAMALAVVGAVVWWNGRKPITPARKPAPDPQFVKIARPISPPPVPSIPAPPPASIPAPEPPPTAASRPVQNVFEAQLALVRQGLSPGSLDGAIGSQTRAALAAFQQKEHLPVTGKLDEDTKSQLQLAGASYTNYLVTSNDLARLQPLSPTWLGKSRQTALDYETILELAAEKSFSHPDFIRQLNPSIDWSNVPAGTVLRLPNAAYPDVTNKAAFIEIHLSARSLEAFDENTNLLAHFPCSIAKQVDKRPVGELHVEAIAPNPDYTFDPKVFPESPEARALNQKLMIPPGPNNPVGVAWISLDRPGYGIHGTPNPEQVGRTESHGCFRLANWNAAYLLRLVAVGTPVYVEE